MKRALVIVFLAGCEGSVFSPAPATSLPPPELGGAGGGMPVPCTPVGKNDEIRLALQPVCSGCHTTGNKPFFASLESFENGLAYDTRYVKPGDPAGSELVQLLYGVAPGSYPQMPPGQSYGSLLDSGKATLPIAAVEDWIKNLPPPGQQLAEPAPDKFAVRRLDADEMVVSLLDQLGLTVEDFVSTSDPNWRDTEWTVHPGLVFIWPVDWAPGISAQYVSDSRALERYQTLGGAVTLDFRKKDTTLGPSPVQTIVQASQSWCKLAINKPGNTAVLRTVTLADTSATKTQAIKDDIGALWLRMLGEVPAAGEVDELFDHVYLAYEPQSTRAAWTAVCAALVRHPQWLTY